MTIRFICPHCRQKLTASDDKAGARIACPACRKTCNVPAPATAKPGGGGKADATGDQRGRTSSRPEPAPKAGGRNRKRPHSCGQWSEIDNFLAGEEAEAQRNRLSEDAEDVLEVVSDGEDVLEVIPDVLLTDEDKDRIRETLAAYAKSIPGHDIENFGQEVEFEKVEELGVYRITLHSLYEGRGFVRRERLHAGGSVPPLATTERNIDLWSYTNPPPAEFHQAKAELSIGNSETVNACGACSGQGATVCDGCSGRKAVVCPGCSGGGIIRCPTCGGSGSYHKHTRDQQVQRHCPGCTGGMWGGDRPSVCPRCNGTAILFEERPVYEMVPCLWCGSAGRVQCPTCGGHRQVACPKCTGTGRLTCGKCQGSGQVVSFLAVVRSFEPAVTTVTVPSAKLPEDAIQKLAKSDDFSPVCELSTTHIPDSVNAARGNLNLRGGITRAFHTALSGTPKGQRIAPRS